MWLCLTDSFGAHPGLHTSYIHVPLDLPKEPKELVWLSSVLPLCSELPCPWASLLPPSYYSFSCPSPHSSHRILLNCTWNQSPPGNFKGLTLPLPPPQTHWPPCWHSNPAKLSPTHIAHAFASVWNTSSQVSHPSILPSLIVSFQCELSQLKKYPSTINKKKKHSTPAWGMIFFLLWALL